MKKLILIMMVALVPFTSWAQGPNDKGERRFDPEKFQRMREEALTKEAALTADEAKAFFQQYNEMRTKQRELGGKIHQLKKNPGSDEKTFAETIGKITRLKVEMSELEQTFYQRIIKNVPAEKVFKVMQAEDDFHRRMVQGQRKRRRDSRQKPPRRIEP